jgi:electron transfer flavoprotein alpha subunit
MTGNVWVLADHWRGHLSDLTAEGLALGRELAAGLGGGSRLEAVLLGSGTQALASKLGAADGVLTVDHPALAEPNPEAYCHALAALVKARRPAVLLVPLSNVAADVIGMLPARLQAALVNFCRDARAADGKLEARCLLYGGKLETTVTVASAPVVVGLLPGSRPAAATANGAPAVEAVAVEFPAESRVRFEGYLDPAPGDVDVTQQQVLVSVGRGIQTQDNIALAEDLAAALGGVVSASRPVIDQGWLPLTRQVGKSGATVKPKLYFAAGISGAPEHVEGMKGAELIIAVNTDPGAPIFGVAHYGIVADALEVLPALTDAVKARKG